MRLNEFEFYNTTRYKWTLCISISVFFYLFMVFFLPFGVDNYNPRHEYSLNFLIEIFYFFLTSLGFLIFNEFLLRSLFPNFHTMKMIVIWNIWTLVFLSTVTYLTYNMLGEWHDFSIQSYFEFIVNCSSVFIFPIVGSFFYFRYQSLRNQIEHILTSKEELIDPSQLIRFSGQGAKDHISLTLSTFLYGRAQENYVELYFIEQNSINKFLIRVSLRHLVESIEHQAILRCHRSFMVNLYHVNAVKGGQNEFSLYLEFIDQAIPVSKTYKESVLNHLRTIKNFS